MKSAPRIVNTKLTLFKSLFWSTMTSIEIAAKRLHFLVKEQGRPCPARNLRFAFSSFVFAFSLLGVGSVESSASGEAPGASGSRQPMAGNIPVAEAPRPWQLVAMRPERDIEAIILDTFNEAVRSGNAGALIKFISRHPQHALADKARQLLVDGHYPPARKTQSDWVDSKIADFDTARREGPDALKAFIAKYPDHPLAAEARRMLSK
jgi:hypothetical protein